jgi:hypothetical protein
MEVKEFSIYISEKEPDQFTPVPSLFPERREA